MLQNVQKDKTNPYKLSILVYIFWRDRLNLSFYSHLNIDQLTHQLW